MKRKVDEVMIMKWRFFAILMVFAIGPVKASLTGILNTVELQFEEDLEQRAPLPLAEALRHNMTSSFEGHLPTEPSNISPFAKQNNLSVCIWGINPSGGDLPSSLKLLCKAVFSVGKPTLHFFQKDEGNLFARLKVIPKVDPEPKKREVLKTCIIAYENREPVPEPAREAFEAIVTEDPTQTPYLMALANLYHFSLGEDRYTHEVKWLELGAGNNVPEAMCSLAINYLNGHGVARNIEHACTLLQRARDQGFRPAQDLLDKTRAWQIRPEGPIV